MANKLRQLVESANRAPLWLSRRLITWMFRFKVKFAGTASIDILSTNFTSARLRLQNRRSIQNHIGSVHAAGMALLAESATGFLVGVNLPDDKLPLLKSMHLQYVKRATGDLLAVASLTPEQIEQLQTEAKGEVKVGVQVTDVNGTEPVICEMVWAWISR